VSSEATIYVRLVGEAFDVWRPVVATPEGGGVYRLPDTQPDDETWEFGAGSRVRCEMRELEGEIVSVVVAVF
jgi:hypothetical protein